MSKPELVKKLRDTQGESWAAAAAVRSLAAVGCCLSPPLPDTSPSSASARAALLNGFVDENDLLAKEIERLRAGRQLLALDHRGIVEENERLIAKIAILEKMVGKQMKDSEVFEMQSQGPSSSLLGADPGFPLGLDPGSFTAAIRPHPPALVAGGGGGSFSSGHHRPFPHLATQVSQTNSFEITE